MPVITISRELGSQGDEVAAVVAQRLGLRLVGRDLINRAARESGSPEVALAEIDELGLLGVKPAAPAFRSYCMKVQEIIDDLAKEGNLLLVGRGGQLALAGRPDTWHVRIIAPRDMRIRVLLATGCTSRQAAEARIEASDRARNSYLKRHYGVPWDEPRIYDLVLNMARLDIATAAELICCVAGHSADGLDAERPDPCPAAS